MRLSPTVYLLIAVVTANRIPARAETPDEWIKLLTRVHGGFGSFLPVGIRIGEDAMKRLDAKPRELSVLFYQGEGTPCPCAADGVSTGRNGLNLVVGTLLGHP